MTFSGGEEIVRQGETGTNFFFVKTGSVKVIRGDECVATLAQADRHIHSCANALTHSLAHTPTG